ncbi:MAG: hypothetical protein FWH02_05625 [Oscillospiraceae bacterium]|nr:hypothetical protein [Oscillospiraceae bacterium]
MIKLKLACAAAVLCVLCGCVFLPAEEELLPPDLLEPDEVTYRTMQVGRGAIRDILSDSVTSGSALLFDMTFNTRSGYLSHLDALPGQQVQKGDILARLDTDSLELDIQRQRLTVERLRLSLAEAGDIEPPSQFPVMQAELDLEMALLRLKQLEDEYADLRWERNWGEDIDIREVNAKITGKARDIQSQKLAIEKLQLSVLEKESTPDISENPIRRAEIDLEMAMLSLRQMEDEFAKATITAPIDGEIVFLGDYKIGEFVPGRRTVLTVADPTVINFIYTGQHIRRIQHGMDAHIIIGSHRIPARVTMTPMTVPLDEQGRYKDAVIFSLDNPEDLPEGTGIGRRYQFEILLEEKDNVILLPREAASTFMNQYYVQVLEDGLRVERDLSVGIVTNTHIEVLSGITEEDLVIIGTER